MLIYLLLAGLVTPQDDTALVRQLAPVLVLHPDEKYGPVDPAQFIKESRFRHHKSLARDEGWSKRRRGWVKSNSRSLDFFNVPVSIINSFGRHRDGRNRRPRDRNCGRKLNVFLDPEPRLIGSRQPNRIIPTFVHHESRGDRFLAQYWFFFGYNDGWKFINHEGDWECIAVHYNKRSRRITGAQFSAHGKKKFVSSRNLRWSSHGRVVGFCSKGTHAIYPHPGSYRVKGVHTDRASASGYPWSTWMNLELLRDQPWRDFAGAWGEVGEFSDTTGPLGPWHKLIRIGESGPEIPRSYGVLLYEHKSFEGRRLFVGESIKDLKRDFRYRFGDRASSLSYNVPAGRRLVLYNDDTYRKPVLTLVAGQGHIPDLHAYGAGDNISSVGWEAVPRRGRGMQWQGYVTLYEHDTFRGRTVTFKPGENESDLERRRFGDKASSVRWNVPRGWAACLYRHHGFRDRLEVLSGTGAIADLGPRRTGDEISSVNWVRTSRN